MPNFGDEGSIAPGEFIYVFDWARWQSWPNKIGAGKVPERVLWLPKSGCLEKYRMVPEEWENPPE